MNRSPFEILAVGAEIWQRADDPEVQRLGSALDEWVGQGGVVPLDRALFGLTGIGQRKLTTVEAMARRNSLLAEAARLFPGNVGVKADAVSAALERYRSGAWLLDRTADTCPARHVGRITELLFEMLKLRDASLGPRRIEQIFGSEMSGPILIS